MNLGYLMSTEPERKREHHMRGPVPLMPRTLTWLIYEFAQHQVLPVTADEIIDHVQDHSGIIPITTRIRIHRMVSEGRLFAHDDAYALYPPRYPRS